jgi:hypothetical protein
MRMLLKVLLPVVVAVVATSAPAAATASTAETAIICPAGQAIIPCCPVPVGAEIIPCCPGGSVQPICCHPVATGVEPICCLTPAICQVPLTIAANPDPATVSQRVVISGTSSPATQITLYQELPGQTVFTQIATTTTNSVGAYAFAPSSVQTDRQWYVTAGSQRSRTIVENVRALVTLVVSRRSGRTVHLRGHVTPSHPGGLLMLEQRHDGEWRVTARIRLDSRSSYAIADTFAHHAVIHLRAVLPGDKWNLRSLSRVMTLTT